VSIPRKYKTSGLFHDVSTESIAELFYSNTIEHTVANIINAAYAQLMKRELGVTPSSIQQLPCILIGSIFYGMVKITTIELLLTGQVKSSDGKFCSDSPNLMREPMMILT